MDVVVETPTDAPGGDGDANSANVTASNELARCLPCIGDGVSGAMRAASYAVCALCIAAGVFATWVYPLAGVPFLFISVMFSALWIYFLGVYKEEGWEATQFENGKKEE